MICLMPMCAYLSETSRMIQIYKALSARGARVCMATHGGVHEALIRAEGIPYDIVGPRMDEERGRRFILDNVGIGDPGQSVYSPDEMRAYVGAEAEYFRANSVKAVVIGFTLTTLISTRVAGIPLITQHAGAYLPPLFERGMLPAPSRPVRPIFKYLPNGVARFLINKGAPRLQLYLGGFNALAAELGVAGVPSFPALLLGDLSLVTEAPEVYGISEEEMRAWRPSGGAYWPTTRLEYTGPIFAELDVAVPDHIESALRQAGPTVYVAITSAPVGLVRKVVEEVASTGANVVVAGTIHSLQDMAGPRVAVGGVLPSHKIMPRVDLAVTAGGQGSVQCAMAAGMPLIGIPLQPEQDTNVHLLQQTGAARLFPQRELQRGKLPALVREMISRPAHKAAARRIQSVYARRDGPQLSADAILRYLDQRMREAA
ncbi:MAG: glycosyltransferase family 1 protein [Hyphomicrobiaceae bacterium]|nr:MAG: glycosyltransferase family 1 protein [Hyphomicrobiaceae bacterium]